MMEKCGPIPHYVFKGETLLKLKFLSSFLHLLFLLLYKYASQVK